MTNTRMTRLKQALNRFGGRLWDAPAYLEYVQPELDDETLREAERSLGVKLPAAYVALLREQNGGYIRGECGVSRILRGIGPQYPSLTENSAWWKPGQASADDWAPPRPELLIPFDGDGHWDMCLDYREQGPRRAPCVTMVSCESESEEIVAPSFYEYLLKLDDSYADVLRVYGDVEASTLARQVSTALGGAEPTNDRFDHGYDEWRIALPGDAQWARFHSNIVPTGFRRQGRRVRVAKETTLQLLEDPDCKVLLSCTDGSRRVCMDCIVDLGFEVRSAS